jgi:hypothetical protein
MCHQFQLYSVMIPVSFADGRLNHKLLGEKFLSQRDRIRDLLVKAVYSDSVDDWLTADGLAGLLALVGELLPNL